MTPLVEPAASVGEVALFVGAAVVAVAALVAVWFAPRFYARRWEDRGVKGSELAEVENGFRTTLVQLIGGVALLATIAATWIQISDSRRAAGDSRRAAERTLALTERGQVTERFTRAITSMGETGAGGKDPIEQRLGGIYGLRRVALDSPADREAIVHIMVAYLREHHDSHVDATDGRKFVHEVESGFLVRDWCGSNIYGTAAADAEAALQVAGAFAPGQDRARGLNLAGVDLRFVRADGVHLERALLRSAFLVGSRLENANLANARISGMFASFSCLRGALLDRAVGDFVDLRGANLARASLRRSFLLYSNLGGTCLSDADLRDATIKGTTLVGADLSGANLSGAYLRGATLRDTDLAGADLTGTDLREADIRGARGLTEDQLRRAKTNHATRLPRTNTPSADDRACNKR